jgi:Peptidase M66
MKIYFPLLFTAILAYTQPQNANLTIQKLEFAQTHLIGPQGRGWSGEKRKNINLHLAAEREALVLVWLGNNQKPKNLKLEVLHNGVLRGTVALNPPNTLPQTESGGEAYKPGAYWAILEKTWVKPGLEVKAQADGSTKTAAQAVRVGLASDFTMYTLPFYLFGLTPNQIPLSQTSAPDLATQNEYFAKHPISRLKMVNHPAGKVIWDWLILPPKNGSPAIKATHAEQVADKYTYMSAILDVLAQIRQANGDAPLSSHYYAPLLMADQAGAYTSPDGGLGTVGGSISTGDHDYKGVFIHEAGHAFGMPHADDGYNEGEYPYIGGSLSGSSWGFDQVRRVFHPVFVPTNASTFKNCANDVFVLPRQKDPQNRCIKQDPMQSGEGDQAKGDKYTIFSDFNAAVVQQYFEGTTSLENGKKVYSGGRIFATPQGFWRWDGFENKLVAVQPQTTEKGLWGLDMGLPNQQYVAVQTIVVTANLAGIKDTNTEVAGETRLTYADTVQYAANTTQIYPPIAYRGNLRRLIDPTNPQDRADIAKDTGTYPWFCKGTGCDYTLRLTYSDNTIQHILLQDGFRAWWGNDLDPKAAIPTDEASSRVWGVNVPAKPIKTLELLETPEGWKGLPAKPKVIATRTL